MNSRIKDMLLRMAEDNPGVSGKFKMAAGIVYKGNLVATGINSYKTHPIMMGEGYRDKQIYLHAEADAIKNSLRLLTPSQLAKAELYVVRVKKGTSGKYQEAMAKPCAGCGNLIANFDIQKVEWTTDEDAS